MDPIRDTHHDRRMSEAKLALSVAENDLRICNIFAV